MHICNKVIAFMIIIPKRFYFYFAGTGFCITKSKQVFSLKINNLFGERRIELKTGLDSQNINYVKRN